MSNITSYSQQTQNSKQRLHFLLTYRTLRFFSVIHQVAKLFQCPSYTVQHLSASTKSELDWTRRVKMPMLVFSDARLQSVHCASVNINSHNLGIITDSWLRQLTDYVVSVQCSAYYLWQIWPILQLLTVDATKPLVHAFTSSHLHKCNPVLKHHWWSDGLLQQLQSVQNAAIMLITRTGRSELISPIPNTMWSHYRICVMPITKKGDKSPEFTNLEPFASLLWTVDSY